MGMTKKAKLYIEDIFPEDALALLETDREFMERFSNFAFDEVVNEPNADVEEKTWVIALAAILMGSGSLALFQKFLPAVFRFGVTPVELKEIVYHGTPYLGFGRVFPFLKAVNSFLEENKIELPLKGQSTTTMKNRLKGGIQAEVEIFGERLRKFYKSGPPKTVHINRWITDNCFGDYYTRGGLDHQQREMITFCFLAAQGGCEPQMVTHAKSNMGLGNGKSFLIAIVSRGIPFLGYPRVLNAVRCIEKAEKELEQTKE